MFKKIIYILYIFIMLILTICIITIKDKKETNLQLSNYKHELDSLHLYFNELKIIQKTMMIAYPVVSEPEAKYYSYIFYDFSKQHEVNVVSYMALVWIESRWNPTLVSSKKCRGLTQLSAQASIDECKKFSVIYKEGVTEWNDVLNIVFGIDYFSSRCDKNGFEYAVRSYIGGDTYKDATGERKDYIDKYTKDFMNEYNKVCYIYKGVEYELEHK